MEVFIKKTLRTNDNVRVDIVEKVTGNQIEKFVGLMIANGWEQADCILTKQSCQELIETLKELQDKL